MEPTPENLAKVSSRHRPETIQRFDEALSLLTAGQRVVKLEPQGMSLDSCAARLRDAIRGYSYYQWSTAPFDTVKLATMKPNVCICEGQVWLGTMLEIRHERNRLSPTSEVRSTVEGNQLVLTNHPPIEVVRALCTLLTFKVINSQVRISGYSLAELQDLEAEFDVALTQLDEQTVLIF